jgi:hypothetical protein
MMELRQRLWVGRLIKLGLVVVGVLVILAWLQRKSPVRGDFRIQSPPPATEALAAGDMRILNRDGSVQLILQGPNILAGLSDQTVAKVKSELERSATDDTAGLGGAIAQMVKSTVASNIGKQVVYPVRDIRDIRLEDGQVVIIRNDGSRSELFGNVKKDRESLSKSFDPDEAERFVEAVRARKKELERP